jgi:hypothetical protein
VRFEKEDIVLRRGGVSRMARGRILVENSLADAMVLRMSFVKLCVDSEIEARNFERLVAVTCETHRQVKLY